MSRSSTKLLTTQSEISSDCSKMRNSDIPIGTIFPNCHLFMYKKASTKSIEGGWQLYDNLVFPLEFM